MNLANQITICRILLVPVFIGLLLYWNGEPHLRVAAGLIFVTACLTDALDGAIARRFHQRTRLGALIDPIADKLLLVSAFFGLAFFSNVPLEFRSPVWLTVAVLSRDVILVAGALTIYVMLGKFDARPNALGKATTFFQMTFVAAVLFGAAPEWRLWLGITAGALTVASGLWYLYAGLQTLSRASA